jgi:hypothetical protein
LEEKFSGAENDVFVALCDTVQQHPGRPAAVYLPEDVRERDDKGSQTAEPNPFLRKLTALRY